MGSWSKEDSLAGAPKWLNADDPNTSNDKDYAFLVDLDEARVDSNRDKGLKTPGWNLYREYTDQNGNTRRIVEPLVVMKVSNADAGDNDTLAPAPVITIGTQPIGVMVTEGGDATFSVAATVTQGATATYQWQLSTDSGSTWANITGATSATYTLEGAALADDGKEFRVIVSAIGATSVTSDEVALVVNAAPSP